MVSEGDSMLSRNIGSQTQVPACSSACTSTIGVSFRKSALVVRAIGTFGFAGPSRDVVVAPCQRHDAIGDFPSVQASAKSARGCTAVIWSMNRLSVL